MTHAAIRATFSDFKLVRGRKVAQLVFEVPLEQADKALATLGGVPQTEAEIWCGIARLAPQGGDPIKERRRFDTLPIAQQIGIVCNEPAFWKFCFGENTDAREPEAAQFVRDHCGVESRSAIKPGTPAHRQWTALFGRYEVWKVAA